MTGNEKTKDALVEHLIDSKLKVWRTHTEMLAQTCEITSSRIPGWNGWLASLAFRFSEDGVELIARVHVPGHGAKSSWFYGRGPTPDAAATGLTIDGYTVIATEDQSGNVIGWASQLISCGMIILDSLTWTKPERHQDKETAHAR